MKGRESRRNKRGGQTKLSEVEGGKLRERLRTCMLDILNVKTHAAFAKALGIPRPTVTSWFRHPPSGEPCTPTVPHLIALANKNISLNWLLLDQGSQVLGATAKLGEIGDALHAHIRGVLASELKVREKFVSAVLPPPSDLLSDLVDRHRSQVRHKASRKLALENLEAQKKSVLAAALGRIARERAARVLLAHLNRLSTGEYADVQDLPSVRPDSDPGRWEAGFPLLVPPLDPYALARRPQESANRRPRARAKTKTQKRGDP